VCRASPTHSIREGLGISLVLSPLGLLKTWCEEWKKCYSNNDGEITNASNPMQMVLVVGHRSAKVADGHSISAEEIQLMKCGKTPRGDDEAPLCIAQLSNGRVTCVTMSQSFDSQVLQRFWRLKIYTWQPGASRKRTKWDKHTSRGQSRGAEPYRTLLCLWHPSGEMKRTWSGSRHLQLSSSLAVRFSSSLRIAACTTIS
jgi:hypothetical protein